MTDTIGGLTDTIGGLTDDTVGGLTDGLLDSTDSTDGETPVGPIARFFAFLGDLFRWVVEFVVNVVRGIVEVIFGEGPPGNQRTGGGWWEQ